MIKRILAAIVAFIILLSLCACSAEKQPSGGETDPSTSAATQPGEVPSYPELMSYADYMKLTPQQQQAYYETFPDADTYMQWFNAAAQAHNQASNTGSGEQVGNEGYITQPTQPETAPAPENETQPQSGGQTTQDPGTSEEKPTIQPTQKPASPTQQESKDPVLLTYAEYLKLTPSQKQAYYESFPSHEAYMQWSDAAVKEYNKNHTDDIPAENEGQITQPEETDAPQEETEPTKEQDVLDGYGSVSEGRE